MALSQDLISQFAKLANEDQKQNTETTVKGTYKTVNGEEYVQIDGSDIWTPVSSTVEAETGERVTVLIKDHTATVTGNITSPSARTKTVEDLKDEVDEQGNTIQQLDNSITQQNNSIIQINNSIKEQNDTINSFGNTIDSQNNVIQALDNTIIAQGNQITSMNNTITSQGNQITSINNTVESQGNTISQHGDSITSMNNTITSQGNLITQQGNTITQQGNTITQQGNTISQQGTTISTLDSNITIINSGFKIEDGVLTGLSEAVVTSLTTDTTLTNSLDASYANIDFANIEIAAVQKVFADSGIIKDLIVSEGKITGELVGVTIKGDLIEGNTVKADKLVVKGSDGLYYKLNVTGETVEAQQTNENSLNGSIITAKSITATKIQVDDLVAFGATIGGFHIGDHTIYSGAKNSINNTTAGIYMGDDGQFYIGDTNNRVRFYKSADDGSWKLDIAADSISFGTSKKTIEEALEEIELTPGPQGEPGSTGLQALQAKRNWTGTFTTVGGTAQTSTSDFNRTPVVGDTFINLDGSSNSGTWQVTAISGDSVTIKLLSYVSSKGAKGDTGASGTDANQTVHTYAGNGNTNMYMIVAELRITAGYINYPLQFKITSRGYEASNVQLMYQSINSVDPTLTWFRKDGDVPLWIYKADTSTWQIIVRKNESWGGGSISNYIPRSGITVTWKSEHISAVPESTDDNPVYQASLLSAGQAAANAQTTANTANTTATNAQTTANTANTNATNAQTAATNAQSTADTANTKIDNLQIGGRNLARKGCIKKYGTGNYTTVNDDNFTVNGGFTFSRTANINEGPMIDNGMSIVKDTNYVTSFKMKFTDENTNSFLVYNGMNHTNTKVYVDGVYQNEFGKTIPFPTDLEEHQITLYYTATKDSNLPSTDTSTSHTIFQPMKGTAIAYTAEVTEFKTETGNKPTDWTPALEDSVVEIGAKNLLLESTLTRAPSTDANWELGTLNNVTSSSFGENGLSVTTPNTGVINNGRVIAIKNANDFLTIGETYTFSIDITGKADYGHLRGFYRGTGAAWYSNYVHICYTTTTSENTTRWTGTFTMPDVGTTDTKFYINLAQGNTAITTRIYKNAKLEKGNKATDWTPAPEDVDSSITNLETRTDAKFSEVNTNVQEAQSSIDVLKNMISHLVTDQNGGSLMTQTSDGWTFNMSSISSNLTSINEYITNNDGWKNDKDSAVNKLTDLINSVSKDTAYITMSKDDSGAPCIELGRTDTTLLGNRNLWVGSGNITSYTGSLSGATGYVFGQSDSSVPSGKYFKFTAQTGSGNTGPYFTYAKNIVTLDKLESGATYTISFYAKASAATTVSMGGMYENQTKVSESSNSVTTSWKRFYATYKWSNTSKNTVCFYFPRNASSDLTIYISSPKIEEGDKVTDWLPAPEDVNSDFKVRITNESIDFMEDTTRIAYASNKTFYVEKMIAKTELQIGEGPGFVWKVRANGNLGLSYISK